MGKSMNKEYVSIYQSPIGDLVLTSSDRYLLKVCPIHIYTGKMPTTSEDSLPIRLTREWLDNYFSGRNPPTDTLPANLCGTAFQLKCWTLLQQIPYGHTVTYKDLAHHLAKESPSGKMSCQAVGQAIRKNPIAIIIPCHRVIGSNGALTGYAGGLDLKEKLLILEKAI